MGFNSSALRCTGVALSPELAAAGFVLAWGQPSPSIVAFDVLGPQGSPNGTVPLAIVSFVALRPGTVLLSGLVESVYAVVCAPFHHCPHFFVTFVLTPDESLACPFAP